MTIESNLGEVNVERHHPSETAIKLGFGKTKKVQLSIQPSSNLGSQYLNNMGNVKQGAPTLEDHHPRNGRVAFVSGHIDLRQEIFLLHYKAPLDAAIAANDSFILSNAGGADSQALEYLLAHSVPASRITIYIHTPPSRRQKPGGLNETMRRIDRLRTGSETLEKYHRQGFDVRVIEGWHAERDAAMTRDSDYDVLWVRSEVETKALYGKKYRAARVSGTLKNKNRREELGVGEGEASGNGQGAS